MPTTAACPGFAYTPETSAEVVQRLVDGGRDRDRQDQSRPVRDRPGRRALALRRAAQSVQCRLYSRRLELGLGGRGVVGPGELLARHRHRGLGPRAGRLQQHRRPEADARPAQHRGRGAGLPLARLHLGVRAVLRRCRPPCSRSSRRSGRTPPIGKSFRFGVPKAAEFFGDAAYAELYAQAIEKLKTMGGTAVEFDYTPFRDAAQLLYSGPWVAERTAAVGAFIEGADDERRRLAGDARHHPRRPRVQRRRCLRGPVRARRAEGARRRPRWTASISSPLPTAGTIYTVAELEREPVLYNSHLGHYTNFVNFFGLCGARLALRLPARRPAVRHHPGRPRRMPSAPCSPSARAGSAPCRCRSARPRASCRRSRPILSSPKTACRSPWSART